MELVGCSCSGFSYTEKYKKVIISMSDCILENKIQGKIGYKEFQEKIEELEISNPSEVRMIIPFLLKAGIINDKNCIKSKTKISELIIDSNFFSDLGMLFIQFIRFEIESSSMNIEQKGQIKKIYSGFGILQFYNLINSNDAIYKDLYDFLLKYEHIDIFEFFILTDCRANDRMNELDKMISDYRENIIKKENINIKSHINSFNYIKNILQQIGVLVCKDKMYYLADNVKQYLE